MRSFHDLARSLTPYFNKLQILDDSICALKFVDDVPVGYVWPNVRATTIEGARIVLVVAAGAVGKSAAAVALAGSLKWPLVDAAKAQVGSYSLSGLLHDALGFESNYIAEVASGRAGIIVDALDEAHLRAGTMNFQAFLDNITKIAGTGHQNTTIVAFSRPDTAEIVKLFLEETGTAYSLLDIDFFEHGQACDYLESRLAKLHYEHPGRNYNVAVRSASGYARLRDERMREIARTLLAKDVASIESAWADVAAFLGYAPVLSVLAEFLAVSNPYRELSRSLSLSGEASNILLRIIDDLLVREQGKFQEQVCQKLSAQLPALDDWPETEKAYSPEEQGVRLVARHLDLNIVEPPPVLLPSSLRSQYEQDAAQFTADHPFLAGSDAVNVVFGDYILAKAAVDQNCRLVIEPDPSKALRSVGPFFYQFVHQFAPIVNFVADEEQSQAHVEENLISLLVDSCTQSQISPTEPIFAHYQSGDDAEFLLLDNLKSDRTGYLEFNVVDPTGVLIFPSRLARGAIFTDGGVVLGQPKERFILGPSVTIICAELDIAAEYLSVDSTGICQSSVINSGSIRVVGRLTVDAPRADALAIIGETRWPALRPYIQQRTINESFATRASYVDLRAILKAFRKTRPHRSNSPTVYGELMNQRIIKNNPRRKQLIAKLQKLQIVSYANNHYYLDTSKLAQFEINWHSMFDGAPTDSILSFLVKLSTE